MTETTKILIVGTADTKADEMAFLEACVEGQGASALLMDVGVLGDPPFPVAYSKHTVAEAAETSNADIIARGDENQAMLKTAEGAASLSARLADDGCIDGVLFLGGTMGTDLALEVCESLPLGFPKVILSTVSFSPLIPPERLAPDVMMIQWAGGLYGLNSICKSSLSLAAGAVTGAARASRPPKGTRPVIGMSSLGKTSLKYMVALKPELEARGFELAVFHTTGMGGRALEGLVAKGALCCVMDFCLVEVSDHALGSVVSGGADRLEGAGRAGVPQIVAPGGVSLVDMQAWAPVNEVYANREIHTHNRLISCAILNREEKVLAAKTIAEKVNKARGPAVFIMPRHGIDEWDRAGGPFHDPEGLATFAETVEATLETPARLVNLDAHINDRAFVDKVLQIFDDWVERGLIPAGGLECAE